MSNLLPRADLDAVLIEVTVHENHEEALLTIVGTERTLTVSIPVPALVKLRDRIGERLDPATRLRGV
jgi:hypothetical protein